MPLYSGAVQMLVPQGQIGGGDDQPTIVPAGVIVHTNASNTSLERLHSLYMPGSGYGGGEAHFDIEVAPPHAKGRVGQFVDTSIRADNNYKANSYTQGGVLKGWISIESGDLGSPYTMSFSDLGQRDLLVDLLVWICRTHAIPPIRATDPFGTGIGWHSMWGYNQRGSDDGTYGRFVASDGTVGELNNPWTNTYGKICPGPGPGIPGGKIGEMPSIIAEVAARLAPPPPPQPPTQGRTKLMFLFSVSDSKNPGAIFFSDGISYKGVKDVATLNAIKARLVAAGLPADVVQLTKSVVEGAGAAGYYVPNSGGPSQSFNPYL